MEDPEVARGAGKAALAFVEAEATLAVSMRHYLEAFEECRRLEDFSLGATRVRPSRGRRARRERDRGLARDHRPRRGGPTLGRGAYRRRSHSCRQ